MSTLCSYNIGSQIVTLSNLFPGENLCTLCLEYWSRKLVNKIPDVTVPLCPMGDVC